MTSFYNFLMKTSPGKDVWIYVLQLSLFCVEGWSRAAQVCRILVPNHGEGNGTPLQYSCLENPMDGGAWKAAVHGVMKSRTRLSDFTFTFHFHALEKEMATHSSAVYGVAHSRTRLKRLSSSSSSSSSRRRSFLWAGLALASSSTRVDRERYGHTWL